MARYERFAPRRASTVPSTNGRGEPALGQVRDSPRLAMLTQCCARAQIAALRHIFAAPGEQFRRQLEEALARYGQPEIFNTAQGSQFTAAGFIDILKRNEIRISMDGRGAWRDNVFVGDQRTSAASVRATQP